MKVVDLHPEDLIDKLATGEMSGAERDLLNRHLRICAVCRIECAARADFDEEIAATHLRGPFLSSPDAALGLGLSEAPSEARRSTRPGVRGRARRLALLAAAAVMIAGVAGASMWSRLRLFAPEAAPAPPIAPPPAHVVATVPAGVRALTEPSVQKVELLDATPATALPPLVPVSPRHPAPEGRTGRFVAKRSPTPAAANDVHASASPFAADPPVTAESTASPGSTPAATLPTAASLFASANAARRRGEGAKATQLYRELQQSYPASDEARTSRATLARLLLDRGEPGAALTGFDQYLSRGGAVLEEEALVGRALALQNLGRRDEEIGAWNEVLRSYPRSVYADHARARLAALTRR
jgi:hypothetical protein